MPVKGDDPTRQVGEMVVTIRKRIWLVAGVTLVLLLIATVYAVSQTKIYRSAATLQLDPRPPRPLGQNVDTVVDLGAGNWWSDQEYYNTQHKIITSKRIALAVVQELGLANNPAFIANQVDAPGVVGPKLSPDDLAGIVQSRLTILPIKESRIVQVTFDDASPERATRVLDAVIRAYMRNNLETATQSTSSAVEWLSTQLATLRTELNDSELALHQYKLDKNISSVGLDDQTNILKTEMEHLASARTLAQAKIQAARARLAQIKKIDPEAPTKAPRIDQLNSITFQSLSHAYTVAEQELRALQGAGKGDNHPDVLAARGKLDTARSALVSEIQNVQSGAERELAALEQEERGLSGLLAGLDKRALDLNLLQIEYNRLARTKDNNEKLYSMVLERTKEASLAQMLKVNNIQVIDPPATAPSPVKPRLALTLALGGLVGLALGIASALLRERFDRTIKSPTDVEERLGLVLLGHVPALASEVQRPNATSRRQRQMSPGDAPELAMHRDPKSGLAEAMRAIRTNILFMSPDKPFRRLLVSSPSPSEGKTTIACCLGVAMAQAGHRVLLLDCDMRKPRLHRVFTQPEGRPSLSQALIRQEGLENANLETEVPNLSVLTAGPPPPNPAELLHSETFKQLLRGLDSKYDLIILDTPPLIVTDAAILSTLVDGSVLVLRSHETDRQHAARAYRAIRDAGGNVVGAILNAVDHKKPSYGYGGHYYYRTSYGAEPRTS